MLDDYSYLFFKQGFDAYEAGFSRDATQHVEINSHEIWLKGYDMAAEDFARSPKVS